MCMMRMYGRNPKAEAEWNKLHQTQNIAGIKYNYEYDDDSDDEKDDEKDEAVVDETKK